MSLDVRDDAGVAVRLRRPPERIVSLVPSVTELVCALGGAASLIAVTRYCTEPREVVAGLPKIGGTKTPDCDAIRALHPDLVLANSEENRKTDYEALVAAGVPVYVSFPTSVVEAAGSIERLGRVLGRDAAARALARSIEDARAAAVSRVERRVRAFCPIWRNPWMSFNRETFAHDVLWCAGADNVCAAHAARYPHLDLADVAARAPEVVLLPDEPYRFTRRHLESLRPLERTPAWRDRRIHFVDGKMISWYGPRTPGALQEIGRLLDARS